MLLRPTIHRYSFCSLVNLINLSIIILLTTKGDKCDEKVDLCKNNFCGALQICNSNSSSYYCEGPCRNENGYKKDERGICVDINECETYIYCPSEARCENLIGSFNCECPTGYIYANNSCQDIDECALGLDVCESLCENTIGSYNCKCFNGYELVDGTKCNAGNYHFVK